MLETRKNRKSQQRSGNYQQKRKILRKEQRRKIQ